MADVVGMFGLKWMFDREVLPSNHLEEYYASYVAGIFRTLRFGTREAHGRAQMMEFNYLSQERAIIRDPPTGRYVIDYGRMPTALERGAKELLEIEAIGDRGRAENRFKRYESMPEHLKSALQDTQDITVDADPLFSFPDRVE